MKTKSKGLMIVAVALLMVAVVVPVYAVGEQSGNMQCPRDQVNQEPPGPTTRAYGEEPPTQAQEEKSEKLSEEGAFEAVEDPIQEQTQTRERLRDGNCENEECEEYQYQHQYQYQYKQEGD